MRYFTLLDFQHVILALFIGLIAVIFVIVSWWRYPPPEEEEAQEDLHTGHGDTSHPIPPLLIFILTGVFLGALGYLIVVGIYGGAIS